MNLQGTMAHLKGHSQSYGTKIQFGGPHITWQVASDQMVK